MNYGERLRAARKKRKLSQPQLAKLSGVKQGTISKIERGGQDSSTFDVSLAIALRIRPEWLATEDGEMEGPDISVEIADLARRLTVGEWAYIKEQAEQIIARRLPGAPTTTNQPPARGVVKNAISKEAMLDNAAKSEEETNRYLDADNANAPGRRVEDEKTDKPKAKTPKRKVPVTPPDKGDK